MGKERRSQKSRNVEFGHEFGDVNSAKIYEIPFVNKKEDEKKTKKK